MSAVQGIGNALDFTKFFTGSVDYIKVKKDLFEENPLNFLNGTTVLAIKGKHLITDRDRLNDKERTWDKLKEDLFLCLEQACDSICDVIKDFQYTLNPSNVITLLNGKYKRVMIETVSDNLLTFIPLSYFCGRILCETYRLTIPNKLRISNLVSQLTIRAFEFQPTVSRERIVSNTPTSLLCKFAELGMTEEEFEESQKDKYIDCYKQMRGLIPNNIANTSLPEMRRHGVPKDAAERIWNKKILWLICMHPNDIPKIHIADLRGKYSFHGLDIVEMRALWKCIPSWSGNNEKSDWKIMFKQRLDDLVMREMTGKISFNELRHSAYANCDGIAFYDYNDELLEQFVFTNNIVSTITAPIVDLIAEPTKINSTSSLAELSITPSDGSDKHARNIDNEKVAIDEEHLILQQRRRRSTEQNEPGKKLIPSKKLNGLAVKTTDPFMARALTSDFDFDNSAPVSPSDDINGMYTPLKKKPNELKDELINPKERNAKKLELHKRKKKMDAKKKDHNIFRKTAKQNTESNTVDGIGNLLCAIPGVNNKIMLSDAPSKSPKPKSQTPKSKSEPDNSKESTPLKIIQGFGLGIASIVTPTRENLIFKGILGGFSGNSDDPASKNLSKVFNDKDGEKKSKKALYVSPKIVLSKEEEDRELQIETEIDNFVIPEELTPEGRHAIDNETDTTFNEDDYSFDSEEFNSSYQSDPWIDDSSPGSAHKTMAETEYSDVVSDFSNEDDEFEMLLAKGNGVWQDVSEDANDQLGNTWKSVFTPFKDEDGAEKGTTTEDATPDAEDNAVIDESIIYNAQDVVLNMESRVALVVIEKKKVDISPEEATKLLLECIDNIEQVNEPLEKMMMLVDKLGANVNACNEDTKSTPLHSLFNHPVLGRFILSRGADILAKDSNGDSPLSLCLEYGYDWIVPAFVANEGESRLKANQEKTKEYAILLLVGGYASRVNDLLEEGIISISGEEALALLESNQNRYAELVEPVETFELLEKLSFQ